MTHYLTQESLEKIKKELDYLKGDKAKEVAELLRRTASYGDLKENAAYHEAREQQSFLQGRILELGGILRDAEIIEKKKSGKVEIGSTVSILINGEKEKIQIVEPTLVDVASGKISYESPLGRAIFNKSSGETVKTEIGEAETIIKILEIE